MVTSSDMTATSIPPDRRGNMTNLVRQCGRLISHNCNDAGVRDCGENRQFGGCGAWAVSENPQGSRCRSEMKLSISTTTSDSPTSYARELYAPKCTRFA